MSIDRVDRKRRGQPNSVENDPKSGAYGAPLVGAPQYRWVRNGLLIIADATINIAHPGYEAYLRYWRCVGTRPYKHVADLGDLTFRLLPSSKEFQAKREGAADAYDATSLKPD
jgi:hypothetical protein